MLRVDPKPNTQTNLYVAPSVRSPGEVHGVHYNFLSKADFLRGRDAGEFLEWAEVHGNFYGTSKAAVAVRLDFILSHEKASSRLTSLACCSL